MADIGRLRERIAARIEIDPATWCWSWTGALTDRGYARFSVNDKTTSVHRTAYEVWVGPIPEGLSIDHLCRNRKCCNPQHLRIVTTQENLLCGETRAARNAAKTHCIRGHKFSKDNTLVTRGERVCRACAKIRAARRRCAQPHRIQQEA